MGAAETMLAINVEPAWSVSSILLSISTDKMCSMRTNLKLALAAKISLGIYTSPCERQ